MASAALVVSRREESKAGLSLKNGPREVGFPQDPENPPISRSHIPFKIVARAPPRMRRRGMCTLKQGLLLLLYHPKHIYYQKEARRFSTFNSANLRMGGCMGMSEDTRSKWASKIMLQLKD